MPWLLWGAYFALFWNYQKIQASPSSQNTIYVAMENAPETLDPRSTSDLTNQHLLNLVHCALFAFDLDGNLVTELVERWSWDDDKSLRLTLKNGATFSDGRPVLASDVKSTYGLFLKKSGASLNLYTKELSVIKSISVIDRKTLQFKLHEPDASIASKLTASILPDASITKEPTASNLGPVGCGPFFVKSNIPSELVLERRTNYSGGTPPKVSKISFKILKDQSRRIAEIKKDDADIVQDLLDRDAVAQVSNSSPELSVLRKAGANTTLIGFNLKDPVVQQAAVRRAISLGINRELIIKHVLAGFAVPAATLLPSINTYYDRSLTAAKFDPAESRRLLDDAGFKDPDGAGPLPRFSLTYKIVVSATSIQCAKAIAVMLKDIGIDLKIISLDQDKYNADIERGPTQLWSIVWTNFTDPDIYRLAFGSEGLPPHGQNRGGYTSPELDRLLTAGKTTTDAEVRKQIYNKVQQLVFAELPCAFLWHEESLAVINKRLMDYQVFSDGSYSSVKTASKK